MAENLLSIDVGTQSVRVLLFDPRGKLIAKQRVPYEPYYSDAPGLDNPEVASDLLAVQTVGQRTQRVKQVLVRGTMGHPQYGEARMVARREH